MDEIILKQTPELTVNYLELSNKLFVYVLTPNSPESNIDIYKLAWIYEIIEVLQNNVLKIDKIIYFLDINFKNLKEPVESYESIIINRP